MTKKPVFLQTILDHKEKELKDRKRTRKLSDIKNFIEEQSPPRGFADQLITHTQRKTQPAVIAEIKRASPSQGVLREDFDPIAIAKSYSQAGATCLSVLTDYHFFKGAGTILDVVRRHCYLPALRKDFIIDDYQIHESRAFGADCILLIAAAVSGQLLVDLFERSLEYDMDVLVEVHNEKEMEQALDLGDELRLVGINNRDLNTFEVNLETTERLAPLAPSDKLVIAESGISSQADIQRLHKAGISAFLIGERLMRASDPGAELSALLAPE